MDEKGAKLYNGEWKNGLRHGQGAEYDELGRIKQEDWWITG